MTSNTALAYAVLSDTVTDIKQYKRIEKDIKHELKPVADYTEKLKFLNSAITNELNATLNDIFIVLIYDIERKFERLDKTISDLYETINLDLKNNILNIALELFPDTRNLTAEELKKEEDFELQNFKIIEI